MSYNWRIGSGRGPSLVNADPVRWESRDGTRWVCSRNVKGETPGQPGRWTAYRKYSLRHRVEGRVVEHDWTFDRSKALAWTNDSSSSLNSNSGDSTT